MRMMRKNRKAYINEKNLRKLNKYTLSEYNKCMNQLVQGGYITYQQQEPNITCSVLKDVYPELIDIDERANYVSGQRDSFMEYVQNDSSCRHMLINKYFDGGNFGKCANRCDICLGL